MKRLVAGPALTTDDDRAQLKKAFETLTSEETAALIPKVFGAAENSEHPDRHSTRIIKPLIKACLAHAALSADVADALVAAIGRSPETAGFLARDRRLILALKSPLIRQRRRQGYTNPGNTLAVLNALAGADTGIARNLARHSRVRAEFCVANATDSMEIPAEVFLIAAKNLDAFRTQWTKLFQQACFVIKATDDYSGLRAPALIGSLKIVGDIVHSAHSRTFRTYHGDLVDLPEAVQRHVRQQHLHQPHASPPFDTEVARAAIECMIGVIQAGYSNGEGIEILTEAARDHSRPAVALEADAAIRELSHPSRNTRNWEMVRDELRQALVYTETNVSPPTAREDSGGGLSMAF